MDVLVVGAGIAGPTLANWLHRGGHQVTLVEQAPHPRRGGHVVDFWGAGYDVARRLGVAGEMERRGFRLRELRTVTATGRRLGSLDPAGAVSAAGERYVSIARSDLAEVLLAAVPDGVELIRGETVTALEEGVDRVRVRLGSGATTDVDLVVGADGLHSQVRRLAFGPEERFEHPLGIVAAAFEVDEAHPAEEGVAVMHAGVGFGVVRFPVPGGGTMVLLTVRHDGPLPRDAGAQQALLRERLAGADRPTAQLLAAMPRARSFYCDRASQIRMPSWSRGRVTLVGDAAAAPSLLAGQGSALAMVEAYVLAAELARPGGRDAALARYEQRLARFVRAKQEAATGMATVFAPANRSRLLLRNAAMTLAGLPGIAPLLMGRTLRDAVELPEFAAA